MSDTVVEDSAARSLGVAFAVAFVCALLVSTVAVNLRPVQRANLEAERIAQLELVLLALSDIGSPRGIDSLDARMVDLATGTIDDSIDMAAFDAERAAASPVTGIAIPREQDAAGLKRRARHAPVYLVHANDGSIEFVILPVSGRGYQSTLHAWLVLDGDGRTVRALKFYQHGETPGVGSRIEDSEWGERFRDLPAFDEDGVLRIGIRSLSQREPENAGYQVDGISGATRTSQGVDGMLRFWLGEFGFGPFLRHLRAERN